MILSKFELFLDVSIKEHKLLETFIFCFNKKIIIRFFFYDSVLPQRGINFGHSVRPFVRLLVA
jgi:hypothetical protein